MTIFHRRLSIPLVCKSWHTIISEPSSLWHDITIDLHQQAPPLRSPVQSFFKRRKDQLRSLHVVLPAPQAGIAADILEALGNEPPLKRFSIDCGGAQAAAIPTLLPQLSWLRNLKALRLSGLQVGSKNYKIIGLQKHLQAFDMKLPWRNYRHQRFITPRLHTGKGSSSRRRMSGRGFAFKMVAAQD